MLDVPLFDADIDFATLSAMPLLRHFMRRHAAAYVYRCCFFDFPILMLESSRR